jgi:hypothetical protein
MNGKGGIISSKAMINKKGRSSAAFLNMVATGGLEPPTPAL